MTLEHVAVVGGSLAGLRAVEALRRQGFGGRVTWIGAEAHRPYDRPPLSKQILLGEWDVDRLSLRRGSYDDLEVEPILGVRASGLDLQLRRLRLENDTSIGFDGLVIATGARARDFPFARHLSGVHVLRTLEDALAIRDAFATSPRVVVVGAGFIGLEVAACARQRGLDVTLVEALDVPLRDAIGEPMGRVIAALHSDQGTRMLTGSRVEAIEGTERVERIRLADGTLLLADLVIVGIGVAPETDWLAGSGLKLDDGVVCDQYSATAAPDVVAAGDVARWYNPLFDQSMRVEHWTNAVEQANAAVSRLLSGPGYAIPYSSVPYFWSDQYAVKIQFAGRIRPDDAVRVIEGAPQDGRFVALYSRAGRLTGALAFNRPAQLIKYRRLLAQSVQLDSALPE